MLFHIQARAQVQCFFFVCECYIMNVCSGKFNLLTVMVLIQMGHSAVSGAEAKGRLCETVAIKSRAELECMLTEKCGWH